ncbi:MAG TPA: hypothetical protein VMP10_05000 [Chloroflexota bacterium]|nr:hypothetical protein [Chloroflexota bacterium]
MLLVLSLTGAVIYFVCVLGLPFGSVVFLETLWPGIAVAMVGLPLIVALDARRHRMSAWIWPGLALFVPFAGLAIYLNARASPLGYRAWRSWLVGRRTRADQIRPWRPRPYAE